MFDIGWSELLVLLVVALVVVGPKDLPRLARMAGRWVGKARAMADQFRKSFDEMAHEAELDDLRAEIDALRRQNPLTEMRDELNRSILPPDSKPAPHIDVIEAVEDTAEARGEEPETDKPSVPPGSEPSRS